VRLPLERRWRVRLIADENGRQEVNTVKAQSQRYIRPLSFDWLTPLYDHILPILLPEDALKQQLIEQAHIGHGARVLDLGAGTATLTLIIKQAYPDAEVVGLDGDPHILEIARAKALADGVALQLDQGLATQLPYDDATFDRVFSSLMLHHLTSDQKRGALTEVRRVLCPGGELHILDFGKPHTFPAYLISLVMRHVEQTADNIRGLLPEMLREAGFVAVQETERRMSTVGTLSLYRARVEA
jgi:ubiquinone/menaquinone biosynthesis C-methylase UbiE